MPKVIWPTANKSTPAYLALYLSIIKKTTVILTDETLYQAIKDIYFDKSDMNHREFCDWASMHFRRMINEDLDPEDLGISSLTANILMDIDAQWNLYLANTYLPNTLKSLNLNNIKSPRMYLDYGIDKLILKI